MSKTLLDSLPPSHIVAPKYSIANFSSINLQYSYMPENNLERLPDTAVNIQHYYITPQTTPVMNYQIPLSQYLYFFSLIM